MGLLVDGEWRSDWYQPDESGRFVRPQTQFRGSITRDGSSGFEAEPERYHLYVSYACPWAQRTLITRHYLGLQSAIGVSVVDPHMGDDGWEFSNAPGTIPDPIVGARFLREIYVAAKPDYTGRVTTPVLWDKRRRTIVNNESREIMRMLDTAFEPGVPGATLLPAGRESEVDRVLDAIYEPINNAVYRAGFARSQAAYAEACRQLFEALDQWETVLHNQRYLCGNVLSEADVAMYTTLVRFDVVYYAHFKCNLRRLQDYTNLWGYLQDLFNTRGFGDTTNFDHIKTHYYWSQESVNPSRIVPLGPRIDLSPAHGRERLTRP